MIKCPECGHDVSTHAPSCPGCGCRIQDNVEQCRYCGTYNLKEVLVCTKCGKSLSDNSQATESSAKPIVFADSANNETPTPQNTNANAAKAEDTIAVAPEVKPAEVPAEPAKPATETTNQTTDSNVAPEEKKSNAKIWIAVAVAVIAIIIGYHFYSNYTEAKAEEEAYTEIVQNPTAENIQAYLDQYPNGAHYKEVFNLKESLVKSKQDWDRIAMSCSVEDFMTYIDNHPDDAFIPTAQAKVDSLMWVKATLNANKDEYEHYLNMDQKYIGQQTHRTEAEAALDNITKLQVSATDRANIKGIFKNFFDGLSSRSEGSITSAVASTLTSFLNKQSASSSDVITFMHKVNSSDVNSLSFDMSGFNISKQIVPNSDDCTYNVTFNLTQKKECSDASKSGEKKFQVIAKIDQDGKISEFNMKKVE